MAAKTKLFLAHQGDVLIMQVDAIPASAKPVPLQGEATLALGETSADGEFSLEAVYCLGNCALGPSALLDGQLLGHVTPSRLAQRLAPLKEAAQ